MSTSVSFDSGYVAQLLEDLQAVLLQTELGGRTDKVAQFSYAGTGSSTYSFGVLQFDVGNNPPSRAFLASIGFTPDQIQQLSQRGGLSASDLEPLNAQLQASTDALAQFTSQQLHSYVTNLQNVIGIVQQHLPAIAQQLYGNPELQLRILDYVNQFGPISSNGPMCHWLCGQSVSLPGGAPVHLTASHTLTGADISDFVMKTKYGVNDPAPEHSRLSRLAAALTGIQTMPAVVA